MKNRLQKLWDEVTPGSDPCPRPDAKKVRQLVDAALDHRPRAFHPHRALKLAAVAAAAALLLTGTALAGGELIPPEFNVLSSQFTWGENPETAIAMMTITPVSVEDDNYALTVTSSLADGNRLYFTLLIEAKNDGARERLENTEFGGLLSLRIPGSNSYGLSGNAAPADNVWRINASATWKAGKSASVRLNLMDEGIWLEFPVKPVHSVTLDINAESQGMGGSGRTAGGPVTVHTVELSPLSYTVRCTAGHLSTSPVPCFLFQDGSIRTMGQMRVSGPSGGSDFGLFNQYPGRQKLTWQFGAIQDLSLMEAVIFGGTAYPLDGGEPYEVDVSAIPRPFVVPIGDATPRGDWTVPLFALCEGLGADCEWDEAAGVATASFRDTTLTYSVGSKTVQVDGPWSWDATDEGLAPVYRDGELWIDSAPLLRTVWSIELSAAVEDWDNRQVAEDGSVALTSWVVNP